MSEPFDIPNDSAWLLHVEHLARGLAFVDCCSICKLSPLPQLKNGDGGFWQRVRASRRRTVPLSEYPQK